jgi:hypothetical protein
MTTSPRGRDTSSALTEIRTVLGRAESARSRIIHWPESQPGHYVETGEVRIDGAGREYRPTEFVASGPPAFDPDRDEMVAALDEIIEKLSRWARTGRPVKKEC